MPNQLLSLSKRRGARKDRPPRRPANNRGAGNATLHDVARLAGVSCMTVSRVLNRPEVVTPNTIEAVRKAIAHTGYIPNLLAGALVSRRSRLVAAIVPTVANSAFTDTIQSLIDRLGEAGYQVFLGLSGFKTHREQDLVTAILSRRPDAIFLVGGRHSAETRDTLLRAKIPVVEEPAELTDKPIDMVIGFSHEKVGQAVANYLLEKGYRRLGLVWTLKEGYAAKREHGFLSTLAKHGITDVAISRASPPSTLRLGREGLAQLLDAGHPLDVVFCATDALAQGVLTEAYARGLSVPKDLAVMGFGDQDFAAYTFPALSTVRVDRAAIGRLAADAILARLAGRTRTKRLIDVGFEITERAST